MSGWLRILVGASLFLSWLAFCLSLWSDEPDLLDQLYGRAAPGLAAAGALGAGFAFRALTRQSFWLARDPPASYLPFVRRRGAPQRTNRWR